SPRANATASRKLWSGVAHAGLHAVHRLHGSYATLYGNRRQRQVRDAQLLPLCCATRDRASMVGPHGWLEVLSRSMDERRLRGIFRVVVYSVRDARREEVR